MRRETQQRSSGSGVEPATCFQASEPMWYMLGPVGQRAPHLLDLIMYKIIGQACNRNTSNLGMNLTDPLEFGSILLALQSVQCLCSLIILPSLIQNLRNKIDSQKMRNVYLCYPKHYNYILLHCCYSCDVESLIQMFKKHLYISSAWCGQPLIVHFKNSLSSILLYYCWWIVWIPCTVCPKQFLFI